MGVLECNRKGCTNIMCTRYSVEYGYICNDCFDELTKWGIDVATFMNSDKKIKPLRYDYDKVFKTTG